MNRRRLFYAKRGNENVKQGCQHVIKYGAKNNHRGKCVKCGRAVGLRAGLKYAILEGNYAHLLKAILYVKKASGLRLIGECRQCGQCCAGRLKRYKFPPDGKMLFTGYGDRDCPKYDKENKRCRDHENNKPLICALWPLSPEFIYPGCGFKFVLASEQSKGYSGPHRKLGKVKS